MDSALPSSSPRARASSTSFLASAYGSVIEILPDSGLGAEPTVTREAESTRARGARRTLKLPFSSGKDTPGDAWNVSRLKEYGWSMKLGLHISDFTWQGGAPE